MNAPPTPVELQSVRIDGLPSQGETHRYLVAGWFSRAHCVAEREVPVAELKVYP